MSILMLATERGIWRYPHEPGIEPRADAFHVDAPSSCILDISARGDRALALADDERLFIWDAGARMFREEEAPADEEFEYERCHLGESFARYLLACPPALRRAFPEGGWEGLGELTMLQEASGWQGLESPYEPRVSAVLEWGDELFASISVGGLLRRRAGAWESLAVEELPRDLRALARAHGLLWLGGGQGLWWMHPDSLECRRASLPPSAGFVARILALPTGGLLVAAAGGPPATWRGPDGSRMSLWHFADAQGVGRPIAGPFHGVITGMACDGRSALVSTDDGELWLAPLDGTAPEEPIIGDLPRVQGLVLVETD